LLVAATPQQIIEIPRTAMSENTYHIYCLVEGNSAIFPVIASPTTSISMLKYLIKEKRKHGVLSNIDATDLTLWRVRMTMASDSHDHN
jgi:hypothetical protein